MPGLVRFVTHLDTLLKVILKRIVKRRTETILELYSRLDRIWCFHTVVCCERQEWQCILITDASIIMTHDWNYRMKRYEARSKVFIRIWIRYVGKTVWRKRKSYLLPKQFQFLWYVEHTTKWDSPKHCRVCARAENFLVLSDREWSKLKMFDHYHCSIHVKLFSTENLIHLIGIC